MGMFTSYDNLPENYIPNNSTPTESNDSYITTGERAPRKIYNVKGNFVAYSWMQGETFDIKFSIANDIENDELSNMEDKTLELVVYDFRWEPVHTFIAPSAIEITCSVDKDITDKLKSGIYYGILNVTGIDTKRFIRKVMFVVE